MVTNKGNTPLAIATHPEDFVTDTAQLGVLIKAVGAFQLSFHEFETMDNTTSIELRDKYLGVSQDIRSNQIYKFNVTANTESQGNNRFELVFGTSGKTALLTTNNSPLTTLFVYPNPVTGSGFNLQLGSCIGKYAICIVNTLGQMVYSATLNHSVSNALESVYLNKKLAVGSYIVIATDANGTMSKAEIVIK